MGYFTGKNKEQNKNQRYPSNHIHVQPSTASMAGTDLISMTILRERGWEQDVIYTHATQPHRAGVARCIMPKMLSSGNVYLKS